MMFLNIVWQDNISLIIHTYVCISYIVGLRLQVPLGTWIRNNIPQSFEPYSKADGKADASFLLENQVAAERKEMQRLLS